ncbi:kinase-like domain-containing protein [Xylariaceae sp. FL0016]|nr:kinase-like domain-containing protein [Xylariaceae sp. FL0016]
MAVLTPAEVDALIAQLRRKLAGTPYACSSMARLEGGTTSFVFRGVLAKSLAIRSDGGGSGIMGDGEEGRGVEVDGVIVKHAAGFAAVNKDVAIDSSRGVIEHEMLKAMAEFTSIALTLEVRTPRAYYIDAAATTHVLEDIRGASSLLSCIETTSPMPLLRDNEAAVGLALGSWLREFHRWTSAPGQRGLREMIAGNPPMRKVKRSITYDALMGIIEAHPGAVEHEGVKKVLAEVRDSLGGEFERSWDDAGSGNGDDGKVEDWGVIHGDFWTGNALLTNTSALSPQALHNVYIIDWEFTQYGHRAYDLGQMIGDLCERHLLKEFSGMASLDGDSAALGIMRGFILGYGVLGEDMGFRTAIHAGVHLLCYCIRRDPGVTTPFDDEMGKMGTDLIVKGWKREKTWFQRSVFACMFERGPPTSPVVNGPFRQRRFVRF